MKKQLSSLALYFAILSTTVAQTSLKKADKNFSAFDYDDAIKRYEKIPNKTSQAQRNLAKSYVMVGNTQKAEETYSKLIAMPEHNAEDVYAYAQTLMNNQKYSEAQTQIKSFEAMAPNDKRASAFKTAGSFVEKIQSTSSNYKIKNLDINSAQQDFGTAYYKDKIVFASSRKMKGLVMRRWIGNNLPYLDMFIANKAAGGSELTSAKRFKQNKKHHEGPASFSADGTQMAFTRNDYKAKSNDDVITLELCTAELLKDGSWSKPKIVPFNNKDFSYGHPSLTPDGKTMYFVSDMPGGKGGVDVYKVERTGETWGTPENLSAINTEGNEMFPFYHKDGILFFSSNGHPGLGGLDIFATKLTNGLPTGAIQNVGAPLNNSKDDFAITVDDNQKMGYFSSNRDGGKGDDDIYSVEFAKPFKFGKIIKGVSKDKEGSIVANSTIELKDANDNTIKSEISDANGNYQFFVEEEKLFNLTGTKEKYFAGKNTANTAEPQDVIISDVVLEKDPGFSLLALITDSKTKEPLDGVTIKITDENGSIVDYVTPVNGDYKAPILNKKLGDGIKYTLRLSKPEYLSKTVEFTKILNKPGVVNVHESLDLSMGKMELGTDIGKLININPIYFDVNKFNIRPDAAIELNKIVAAMNEYPAMVIELGSHTDCRAPKAYNANLSDKRAKSSAAYVVSKGISKDRIYGKGYGESKLINGCACEGAVKSTCSDEEHQANRRTEFIIVKLKG
jgi:outer membrane protein OmpA-like peptidoglycan-associated protein